MLNYLSKKKKKKNDGYFSVISKNKTVGKKNSRKQVAFLKERITS